MPIPPLKRRTYGYISDEPERKTISHGEKSKKPKSKNKKIKPNNQNIFVKYLVLLILLPFKFLPQLLAAFQFYAYSYVSSLEPSARQSQIYQLNHFQFAAKFYLIFHK